MNIKSIDSDGDGGMGFEASTLVDLMQSRARCQPERVAYTFLAEKDSETSLTYGDLDRQARAIAGLLQTLELSGERVLLLYPPGMDYIAAFLGCVYAGAVAVPSYPPRFNRSLLRLQNIIADAQASGVLTTTAILARAEARFDQSGLTNNLRWLATDDIEIELARQWREPKIDGDTIAFLQYTSGSTSSPKGVMVSHGNILHNQRMIQTVFHQTADSVIASWLPLYHDMGLIGTMLQPLYLGAKCVLMSPASFLQQPFRWLDAISRYKATTSGGPNFAYELCVNKISAAQRELLDLSSWKVAFNGAEPIRADTLERFAEEFAPCGFRPEAFYPCYGLAEATLLVSGRLKSGSHVVKSLQAEGLEARRAIETLPDARGARRMVGCGQTLMGQKAIIVNVDSLTECSAEEIGEIWVSGPSIAQGYWKRPLETAHHFGAYLTDTGEGPFLRTGDLGFFLDGELFVTGRLKDLIIVRGANYYPQDIELTVESSHAELRAGCGAAFAAEIKGEERLVIVQEVEHHHRADNDSIIASIREAISEAYELQTYAVVLVRAGTIPKTSSGKIQRHACREGFLCGSLELVADWRASEGLAPQAHKHALIPSNVEAIEGWLRMQFAARLGIDPFTININQPIARYGIDSLASIELIHSIETGLGVKLAITDVLEGPTIAQLATHIKERLTPGSHPRGAVSALEVCGKTALPPPTAAVDSVQALPKLCPLSHSQKSLWFLHQLAPQSAAYNVASAIRIKSELDIAALQNAFQALIDRHSSLRTTFTAPDGSPLQRVHSRMEVFFHREDISAWDDDAVNARLVEEAYRPFDLEEGPLLRVYLFSRSTGEHILLIAVHHIVVDFWSLAVLLHELGRLYQAKKTHAPLELEPLSLQYSDYALWQAEMLASAEGERLRGYWQEQLNGKLPSLNLPIDKPRPNIQTYRGASVPFKLSVELTQGVKALSQAHNATPFMTLLAAFQVLLHRYTNQDDILVGSPMAGRTRAGLAGLVGYFANPVVLRADLSMNPTFHEFVDQVRHTVLAAFNHQDYPFALLVEQLQVEWDPACPPVFQVMFVFQKAHLLNEKGLASYALGESGVQMELEDLSLESKALEQQVAQFDLTMIIAETDGVISGALQYNEDLFEEETVRRMTTHYGRLLEAVTKDAVQRVCDLQVIGEAERGLIQEWNDTAREYEREKSISEMIEYQAGVSPEAIAIESGEERISYEELNRRANQLGQYLRRRGVGAEKRVGICVERGIEMVVGMLGILKAGGAYVPMDPGYPKQRLEYMAEDAEIGVLVTEEAQLEEMWEQGGEVVCVDRDKEEIGRESDANFDGGVTGENLAYVIYTSGSTGKPKGVAIEHHNLGALIEWSKSIFEDEELDGVLASTSLCFDLSVFEILVTLSRGGRVIVAENALELAEMGEEAGVRLINTVPSAMGELVRMNKIPASVKVVNLAGEALKNGLAQEVYKTSRVEKVWNLYGPSEDTTYSTYALVERGGSREPAIGRGISNTEVYILDERQQVVPIGVRGELCISGEGLARGYIKRPEQTAEKFIPNQYSKGAGGRLYRTGDLARYRGDGEIEYLGRIDQQVKIRGYRIELGEIEAALGEQEGIKESVVLAREEGDEKRLVGYVVVEEGEEIGERELRRRLKERLPEYMVPTAIVRLEEMPLTANGKIDRKGLAKVEVGEVGEGRKHERAATAVEEVLEAIFAEVLGVKEVSRGESFFDLGGHSLKATRLMSRVREAFSIEMGLVSLFEEPTIAGLGRRIEEAVGAGRRVEGRRIRKGEREYKGREGIAPLSSAQQRLYFLEQLRPGSSLFHMPAAVRVRGELKVEAMEKSFNEIVRRHEALRTNIGVIGGEAVQVISEKGKEMRIAVIDLEEMEEERRGEEAKRLMGEEAREGFDLERGMLVRARVIRMGGEESILQMTMHHIVSDGWSMGVLVKEVGEYYEAYASGKEVEKEELEIQYGDYAKWEKERIEGGEMEEEVAYWKKQLEGAPEGIELPTDRVRGGGGGESNRGGQERFEIGAEVVERLKEMSREEGVTMYMLLLAGMGVMLRRWSGQEEVVIGSLIANRNRKETEGLIGMFVNAVAMRVKVEGEGSYREVVRRVREAAIGGYANQDVPFEKVVEAVGGERDLSRSPIFQVVFTMQNAPMNQLHLHGLESQFLDIHTGTTKYELALSIIEEEGKLKGSIEYSKDLFEEETIKRLATHYSNILKAVIKDAGQRVCDLEVMGEAERGLIQEWNDTTREYEREKNISQMIEHQAAVCPEATAIECGQERMTYGELNGRANRLGHYLRKKGVGGEQRVGICVERGIEMVVGMLGILKAGGAYVPMDPGYPRQRLAYMAEDAQISLLVTQGSLLDQMLEHKAEVVCLDRDKEEISGESDKDIQSGITGENLAYVIYTSGSTGVPKGVQIQHGSLMNLVCWHVGQYRVSSKDRATQMASIGFDAAVWEIWPYLVRGARVCIIDDETRATPEKLRDWLVENEVTMSFQATPLAERFIEEEWPKEGKLRYVLTGGDRLRRYKGEGRSYELVNHYGPTESTVLATSGRVGEAGDGVPAIGKAITNTEVYILDERQQVVPIGVRGELCISGEGLARGYIERPDLTAEKFIPNQYGKGAGGRLYRTGDLARYRGDGEIEYLGRIDQQVKIRGYRIELGEIEAALGEQEGIKESVVLAREEGDEKRLVGYVVVEEGEEIGERELRRRLKERLPEYMVPTAIVRLEEMPLTANGKIDRKGLAKVEVGEVGEGRKHERAATAVEEVLEAIFAEVLGVKEVSRGESFFDLGGHSLKATRLMSRVREAFSIEMGLVSLFEEPTIAGLGRRIEEAVGAGRRVEGRRIRKGEREYKGREGIAPLSSAQQRLYFLEQLRPGSSLFHMPAAVRVRGELKVEAMEKSFNEIVRRHEALRTNIGVIGGEAVQVISEKGKEMRIAVIDLEEMEEERRGEEAKRLMGEEAREGFDLERGMLVRARVIRMGGEESILQMTMHHIVSDGWSMGVLVKEVGEYYEAYASGKEVEKEELEIQYGDYAKWEKERIEGGEMEEEVAYWKKQLEGAPEGIELPTDRVRGGGGGESNRGGQERFEIGAEVVERLKEMSREEGVTMYMLLLAGMGVMLRRWSGQEEVVIGSLIANRNRKETEGLIGMFVNAVAMRVKVEGEGSYREVVRRVREAAIGGYANQDVPFEKVVEAVGGERDLSRSPIFQVVFTMQNAPMNQLHLHGLIVEPIEQEIDMTPVDLTFSVLEEEGKLKGSIEYNKDLFEEETIRRLATHYSNILKAVIKDAGQRVCDLELMGEGERTLLLQEWNNTRTEYPLDRSFHELFEEQVKQTPAAIAAADGQQKLSYRDLNSKANRLARALVLQGVSADSVVGLYTNRGLDFLISMIAVFKAGGAYLPLDPSHPGSRTAQVIESSGARLLLTTSELAPALSEALDLQSGERKAVFEFDELLASEQDDGNLPPLSTPSHLAYVIYTSGSTGAPKGAMVEHKGMLNHLFAKICELHLGESDIIAQTASQCFDISVWQFLAALLVGGQVHILDDEITHSPALLIEKTRGKAITVLEVVPSMLRAMLEESALSPSAEGDLSSLRWLIATGESLPPELTRLWLDAHPEIPLMNAYGPTECSDDVTHYVVRALGSRDSAHTPIGRPISNMRMYILDDLLTLLPLGVVGELCVGGIGVGRGYLNDPSRTAEAFLPDPFGSDPGARLYKTGDLVRYLPDGNIEFLGRVDHQVKIRGFRIEMREIEAVLARHEAVRAAVVVDRDDAVGDKRLVAYVVTNSDYAVSAADLREHARQQLPHYMVPSDVVMLDSLPFTPNGKLDRKALPVITGSSGQGEEFVGPRTGTEQIVAEIWKQVLGEERIGVRDKFFDIGGDSLKIVRIFRMLAERYPASITVVDLFNHNTVEALSSYIDGSYFAEVSSPVIEGFEL